LKLQSFLLSRAEYLADGKLILIGVKQSEIDAIGATDEDRTKLGNFFVSIDGVEMSAFIREENGACKGSLRARDERYRADLLGQKFGGGGHKKASGIGGPGLNEALETFLPRFRGEFVRHWGVYGQVSR
jgi:phosphoesterase RecJ-like protein